MDKLKINLKINNQYLSDILTIIDLCKSKNINAFLCGGCVRDLLLEREPKDYDICYEATPDDFMTVFTFENSDFKIITTGLQHGTVTLYNPKTKNSFECTATRSESTYSDNRHPDTVKFISNLEEDLKRRDFTINSFAYDIINQELLTLDKTYFNDLQYGIIRTVGNPEERFSEDALRMLRALRFMAQLNFSIDTNTFDAIKKLHSLIANISKERIRDELTKILLSDNPQVLELFVIAGLEKYSFGKCDLHPELEYDGRSGITPIGDILNCEHQNPWHYTDVFHHTMDVIKRVPKTFELRWAALFHDCGKPAVKELKEGTVDHYHYHGHQDISTDIALTLMEILKFSNDQKDLIYKFVKYHDLDLITCRNATFKRVLVDIGKEHFANFIKLKLADALAHKLTQGTKWAIDAISKLYERFDKTVAEEQALTVRDLAINGYDIIADGFLQGKEIGDCLKWMLDIVLEHPEYNTREKLLEFLEIFKEMSFQSS